MKTVSLEMGKRLKEAGWEKETTHHYLQFPDGTWAEWEGVHQGEHLNWLPRPTLDEVVDDLPDVEDLHTHWKDTHLTTGEGRVSWMRFSRWLYRTLRSADAAAEVWIKVKGK